MPAPQQVGMCRQPSVKSELHRCVCQPVQTFIASGAGTAIDRIARRIFRDLPDWDTESDTDVDVDEDSPVETPVAKGFRMGAARGRAAEGPRDSRVCAAAIRRTGPVLSAGATAPW